MKHKYKTDIVVVDYLQLMQFSQTQNLARAVGDVAKMCKNLAKDIRGAVILTSQVRRTTAEQSEKRRPTLSDLKESGDIEASADIVILVHRKDKESTHGELIVAKDRNHGGTGNYDVAFDHFQTRFLTKSHEDFQWVWDAETKENLREKRKEYVAIDMNESLNEVIDNMDY